MKAISLWQPWANLMVCGAKRIETRDYKTNVRGWVLIHAAKRWGKDQAQWLEDNAPPCCKVDMSLIPRGAIVGAVRIVDCQQISDAGQAAGLMAQCGARNERRYGNYLPGRFAWITNACARFKTPVEWKGKQGWFNVPGSALQGKCVQLEAGTMFADVAGFQTAIAEGG